MTAHMRHPARLLGLTLTMTLALATADASARSYTVTDLGALGVDATGTASSNATAINNNGDVVGFSAVTTGGVTSTHAFVYRGGVLTDLGRTLAGSSNGGRVDSYALGINDAGTIVGYSYHFDADGAPVGPNTAFVSSSSRSVVLGTGIATGVNALGQIAGSVTDDGNNSFAASFTAGGTATPLADGQNSAAGAINVSGQASGFALITDSDGAIIGRRAALFDQGTAVNLGTLGGAAFAAGSSNGYALNDAGQVVGGADGINADGSLIGEHAVLWQNGTAVDLGTLGRFAPVTDPNTGAVTDPSFSLARGINNAGVIVGESEAADGAGQDIGRHGFVYDGALVDLNTLIPADAGLEIRAAVAINDAGQIAATASSADGSTHAVLLTPDAATASLVVALAPRALSAGATTTATMTLAKPAARSQVVALSSSNRAVAVPSSVTVPAGKRSVTFPVHANPVKSTTVVTIKAAIGKTVMHTNVGVRPKK